MNSAGDRVAIGAYGNDGNGSSASRTRLRIRLRLLVVLGSDGEAGGDNSGFSVSMNSAGDRVAIGLMPMMATVLLRHVRVYEYASLLVKASDIDSRQEVTTRDFQSR